MNACGVTTVNVETFSPIFHMRASLKHIIDTAFDHKQLFTAMPHKNTGQPSLMIKREFIQFPILSFKLPIVVKMPRHFTIL